LVSVFPEEKGLLNIDEIQCFFQKAKKESETVNISILYQ